MFKRIVVVVAVFAAQFAVPAVGGAKHLTKSHTVKLSGLLSTLSTTGTAAVPGTKETDAGILDGKIAGRSQGRAAFYQTATWGSGLTLTAKGTVFNSLGSVRYKLSVKFTLNPNATQSYSGKLIVTGGTAVYRKAHGTLQISGNAPTPADPVGATVSLVGKLSY